MRIFLTFSAVSVVALLAEGVDRNQIGTVCGAGRYKSPSSRRAWIEIPAPASERLPGFVALLAEGVDRNRLLAVI